MFFCVFYLVLVCFCDLKWFLFGFALLCAVLGDLINFVGSTILLQQLQKYPGSSADLFLVVVPASF